MLQWSAFMALPFQRQLTIAFQASWAVNIFLLGAKIVAYVSSKSKAILASLADSGGALSTRFTILQVDLASQAVISFTEYKIKQRSDMYPVGRARLEALGVIGCACIMMVASLEVIQLSAIDLAHGFQGHRTQIHLTPVDWTVLAVGTFMKLLLYLYCVRLKARSDSMGALAEDHINDVASNLAAIIIAVIATLWKKGWWVDPVGGILISAAIIWRWVLVTLEQVRKIVGHVAPVEFTQRVEMIARTHHEDLTVDITRAYHFGARYNVEIEIILPGDMSVRESHDIALELQHKIEALEEVERAFVHVDYASRELPEHKVERTLLLGSSGEQSDNIQEAIQHSLQRRTGSRRQLDAPGGRGSVEVVSQEASSSGAPV